jgi:hypothetical protein
MNDYKATAIFHVLLELQAKIGRPVRSVIVEHDSLISGELRFETAEIASVLRRGSDGDPEATGVFQFLFQYRGCQLPVVIGPPALPVEK